MEPFQFDYVGYLKNMVFLIILMGIMSYILIKLKTRDSSSSGFPKLSLLNSSLARKEDAAIEVIERKVLEPRKTLYLVRVFDEQYWLIGSTDSEIKAIGQIQPPTYTNQSNETFAECLEKQEPSHETHTMD